MLIKTPWPAFCRAACGLQQQLLVRWTVVRKTIFVTDAAFPLIKTQNVTTFRSQQRAHIYNGQKLTNFTRYLRWIFSLIMRLKYYILVIWISAKMRLSEFFIHTWMGSSKNKSAPLFIPSDPHSDWLKLRNFFHFFHQFSQ